MKLKIGSIIFTIIAVLFLFNCLLFDTIEGLEDLREIGVDITETAGPTVSVEEETVG